MTCGLDPTSSNRLSLAFNTNLSSDVVMHLVIVHLVDWKGEYQRHAFRQCEPSSTYLSAYPQQPQGTRHEASNS